MNIFHRFNLRWKSIFIGLICILLTIIFTVPVNASVNTREYIIRIYAGSIGTFSENAKVYYQSLGARVSDTCVEMQLKPNDTLPKLPGNRDGFIKYNAQNSGKYYVMDRASMGAGAYTKNSGTVSRSEDVTIQYGRLLEGVEYTVKYVEQGTGIEIALPKIIYEEAGKDISESAISIAGFTLVSSQVQTIQLVRNGNNSIVFEYTRNSAGTSYSETTSTEMIDGGTSTEYIETEIPTYVVTTTAGEADGAAGGADAAAGGEIAGEVAEGAVDGGGVDIPEGDVPLSRSPISDEKSNDAEVSDQTTELLDLPDQDIPLSESPFVRTESWVWIMEVIGALLLLGAVTFLIVRYRLKKINKNI